ncbi:unnamed protein product [Rotaria sordida]|uniref:Uncharacterized protein n=1 Tax=Rotaria sordida TaxID=392033 RepID=A0A814KS80_9BILA|nr:unnamed protein product [Rotaria sordida]CAF1054873.1 unnamed protein product [Rotaria sordida]CAF1059315.1 unnamed protein product [Rotaria sordida]CAF1167990.1 unnamed protein product [Rotaria sordida]CAF1443917.1 unnamed protein product [Rotaria sordida]
MYGRKRNNITSYSQYSEDEHDELSNRGSTLVMLAIHNLDHMMQPHEWETLLTREIHGARILGVIVVREPSLSRPWGEGELTAYIFTRHDASLIRQYLHNRRLGFRRLHVDTITSEGGIEVFLVHKILQLLKLNPQMSDITIEQRINSFFRCIPLSVRPRDYDRTTVMRLIHECMGLPASPPATSEDSEIDGDSPPLRFKPIVQPLQQQILPEQDQSHFNPSLIRIDECTKQLHFTPFYFELLEAMSVNGINNENEQLLDIRLF